MKMRLTDLAIKLDAHTAVIEALREELQQHVKESRQFEIGLDRLVQVEENRKWHVRALWLSILASIGAWFAAR